MDFTFSGNWCKFTFVALSTCFLIFSLLMHILNFVGIDAGLLSQLVKYGKLVKNQSSALKIPKSSFKLIYLIALVVYVPIALWQVIKVYVLLESPSEWALAILRLCCGTNRVVTGMLRLLALFRYLKKLKTNIYI